MNIKIYIVHATALTSDCIVNIPHIKNNVNSFYKKNQKISKFFIFLNFNQISHQLYIHKAKQHTKKDLKHFYALSLFEN